MTSSINITLGTLKHIAADIDNRLDGVNIATLRLEIEGDLVRVFSIEKLLREYEVSTVTGNMPIQLLPSLQPSEVVSISHPTLEAALQLNAECEQLTRERDLLRNSLERIIQQKNDGSIQFLDEQDFYQVIKAYNQTANIGFPDTIGVL